MAAELDRPRGLRLRDRRAVPDPQADPRRLLRRRRRGSLRRRRRALHARRDDHGARRGHRRQPDIAAYLTNALSGYPTHHDEATRTLHADHAAAVEITFTGELADDAAGSAFDALDVFDFDERPASPSSRPRSTRARSSSSCAREVRGAAGLRRPVGRGLRRRPRAAPGARPSRSVTLASSPSRSPSPPCCSPTRPGGPKLTRREWGSRSSPACSPCPSVSWRSSRASATSRRRSPRWWSRSRPRSRPSSPSAASPCARQAAGFAVALGGVAVMSSCSAPARAPSSRPATR